MNKFKELKGNKKYSMNAIIFILAWTIFQTSYATPFIAFNTLGGNLQQNVFLGSTLDQLLNGSPCPVLAVPAP